MHRFSYLILITLFWSCTKSSDNNPHLSDLKIIQVRLNSIVVTANITANGNPSILQSGFCWSSTTSTPTIDSSSFLDSNQGATQLKDTITGLTYNTKYYIRAFIKNTTGVFYSKTDSATTLPSSFKLGQAYQGGYIFYIDSTGEHGLVACKTAGHCYWTWWQDRMWQTWIGTSTKVGKGQDNTKAIIAAGVTNGATAAMYCDNLVSEGYDHWFLPSWEELKLLRENLGQQGAIIGLYPGDIYWSSSEVSTNQPGYVWFVTLNGMASFQYDTKDSDHGVVPVRKF